MSNIKESSVSASKKSDKKEQMLNRLKEFKANTTPTGALLDPTPEEKKEITKKTAKKTKEVKEEIDQKEIIETESETISIDKFKSLSNKREKIEDTHSRKTFLVRNDLIERLKKVADNKHHGFQTEFINIAIEFALDQVEK